MRNVNTIAAELVAAHAQMGFSSALIPAQVKAALALLVEFVEATAAREAITQAQIVEAVRVEVRASVEAAMRADLVELVEHMTAASTAEADMLRAQVAGLKDAIQAMADKAGA